MYIAIKSGSCGAAISSCVRWVSILQRSDCICSRHSWDGNPEKGGGGTGGGAVHATRDRTSCVLRTSFSCCRALTFCCLASLSSRCLALWISALFIWTTATAPAVLCWGSGASTGPRELKDRLRGFVRTVTFIGDEATA